MDSNALNRWTALSTEERKHWLARARLAYLEEGRKGMLPPDQSPGQVFHLLGRSVTDLPGFFCALGEAINGPAGYFGMSLRSLGDCCAGGFGATVPFVLRWHDSSIARVALDHAQLAAWAEELLENRDYFDIDERRWLIGVQHLAANEEGPTLFEQISETLRALEIEIEYPPETRCPDAEHDD